MRNNIFIEKLVAQRWGESDDAERNALIDLMVAFESPSWSRYVYQAERNALPGSGLILGRQREIIDSSVRGVADHDNTIAVSFDVKYYQRQVGALANYLQIITKL